MSSQAQRSARLAKLFDQTISGKRTIANTADLKRFLEAVQDQSDPPACVERIVASQTTLTALRTALRFNLTADFIKQTTAPFIQYLSDPRIKQLCNGQFLQQLLMVLIEPPTLWNAFLDALRASKLDSSAIQTLLWMLVELLSLSDQIQIDVLEDSRMVLGNATILGSSSVEIRTLVQKIERILLVKSSGAQTNASGHVPGGRHDNDFVDFRQIAILPTAQEFLSSEKPFYRQASEISNLPADARIDAHLDNQFRLLREDMLVELREDLQIARGKKKGKRSAFLLRELSLVSISCGDERRYKPCTLGIQCRKGLEGLKRFDSSAEKKAFLKDNRNFLKHQALGCLVCKNEIVAFATVDRDIDTLASSPPVVMLLIAGHEAFKKALLYFKMYKDVEFLLVDTPIFAYEPVLKCLQSIPDLALTEELLLHTKKDQLAETRLVPPSVLLKLEDEGIGNLQNILQTKKPVRLDPSQLESLCSGLKQRLSLIQGPPGTGKSFIGALLAKVLHDQTKETILVMCYTNHALDQFLEDFLDIGIQASAIVRLGSQCTPRTEFLRLQGQTSSYRRSTQSWNSIDQLKTEARELKEKLVSAFQAYQSSSANWKALLEYLEFEEPDFYEALSVPEQEDGMSIAGKDGKAISVDHLFNLWAQGKDEEAKVFLTRMSMEARQAWEMDGPSRQAHIQKWMHCLLEEHATSLSSNCRDFNRCQGSVDRIWNENTREILKSKRIIGCTTTAAAKYTEDLRAVSPGIILVEEAGEILESHILTAMSSETKQLVLIGDHQQLRPKVNNYGLTVEKGDGFDLNRSLFERLVLAGYPHTTLSKQHRMIPEISTLVRHLTYPDLQDDAKTMNRPSTRGLQDRVIFFHHEKPEATFSDISDRRDEGAKGSKWNVFEVDIVLKIVKYLGQQGYGTDKLVILTPYLGQLHLLRQQLQKENDPWLNDLDSHDLVKAGLLSQASARYNNRRIRISTIDNYQGEESDIVIASLTRSNADGDIGFMAAPQRLNVLLSRARNTLIMVGNINTFTKSKKGKTAWVPFVNLINANGHLYDGLPVKCEQHPHKTAVLKTKEDFDIECPDGGCAEPCGVKLSCGIHECPSKCHQLSDHSKMPCYKIVEWECPRNHRVSQACVNAKGNCTKCQKEDLAQERKRQRDTALDIERQRRQREYEIKLAELQDEIEHERRLQKDKREREDQTNVLNQLQQDLASLKIRDLPLPPSPDRPSKSTTVSSPKTPESPAARPKDQSVVQKAKPKQQVSAAKEEWEWQKKYVNAQSPEIDTLMDMIGLEEVKSKFLGVKLQVDTTIRQKVDIKTERFGSVFLGNPGTGKTTVARLYAKFLASVGVLPGNFFVETTGSRLANDGVTGCQKTLDTILNNGGGALFIDEAYQLVQGQNSGGTQVLNFLLAEVENLTGKIVFILAGYQRQMEEFFSHNPGLPSRFPHELKFHDYTDNELLQILEYGINKRYQGRMKAEDGMGGLYCRIVARRIGRGRGREGFGNARAVENTRARISERQAKRLALERRTKGGSVDDLLFTKEDLIGPEPSQALEDCSAWEKLQSMIGLDAVKKTIKALLDSIQFNYQRELEEKPPVEFTLNRVFLGSPGTGKTTVAKLYGEILVDLGLLSNGEVIVKNPADFVGAYLGQSEKTTKGILASTVGKVLVIDEAYGLNGDRNGNGSGADSFKTAVIDTIVAEVQSTPGDDRCVLLLGYKDEMEAMFQKVNPGLTRRFPLDQAFNFEDFNEGELGQIFDLKLKQQGFDTTPRGRKVALEILERARNRPNFGNAGEIDIMLNGAKVRHQQRLSSTKRSLNQSTSTLEPQDLDPDFDRGERADTNIPKLFEGVVGCEEIVKQLEGYRRTVKHMRELEMDPREQIPFNFLFRGPPGTGKTSTARKMGKVYYDMGFLAAAEVVEASATDLVGQYIGHTGPKTQKLLEKAMGKILFIDEAYRLGEGQFAKEAMDEIVDCITKPKFYQKLIIILAGYDADINRLMDTNPGLTSRFPESIQFPSLSPNDCISLLTQLLQEKKSKVKKKGSFCLDVLEQPREEFIDSLRDRFLTLSKITNWANARDVQTLAKGAFGRALQNSPPGRLRMEESIILLEIDTLLNERQDRQTALNPIGQFLRSNPLPAATDDLSSQSQNVSTGSSTQDNPPPAQGPPPEQESNANDTKNITDSRTANPTEPRDAGVSDEVYDQLQRDKAAAEAREKAYAQLVEEDRAAKAEMERVRQEELEAIKAVEDAQRQQDEEAKKKLEKERIERELARRKQEEELERIRRKREEMEQKRLQDQKARAKLRQMGVCSGGYNWVKQSDGYRCAGGICFVSNAQLNLF
ncbi:hypothetical protein ASPZODRAFT_70336 [Penicilliopsis zonata CBS 506.65]|uniref:AAA+ ATPase domain-containing protein n=1 Tax=Penicilliopsis zonata CBS 506.65 TaxID=1073090 RepID=A0A1L9SD16_9EURO|nr:hypothetical protein ASPZODRAFT_70336 [Penicilliopsis zonata CBS 506.65]OJJ44977.1 hypothetical protein ASPZODRAFT_70336 [Penicilliopsis zonata CBS 506.65]